MNSPADSDELVHISLRIPTRVERIIKEDAKHRNMNFNSFASRILTKYVIFDRLAEHVNAIPLNGRLYSGMLEDTSVAHLEQLGQSLGSELIREAFIFLDLEYTINGLIRHYFEPLSAFSNWYAFSMAGSGPNRRLMFKHSHGPKWSAFLKAYISSIIKTATGVEPKATADDHIVTFYC